MRHQKNTGLNMLLKAIEMIDADLNEAADNLGVELPRFDTPQDMDAVLAAFEELEVEAAAQRARQILEQAGRDFVAGRLPAMAFMEIERRVQAASEAINRRAARLEPFGGS